MTEEVKKKTNAEYLKDYQDLWVKDAKYDLDDPEKADKDTLAGAKLHAKYIQLYTHYKRKFKQKENEIETTKFWLEYYYKDGLYHEELGRTKNNPKIAKTKEEAKLMTEHDPKMLALKNDLIDLDALVDFLTKVVDYIRWCRNKEISNNIEMKKWYNGQM